MAYKSKIAILFLSLAYVPLAATSIFAQSRPASSWWLLNKPATPSACHSFARDALAKEGLAIIEDSPAILVAHNDHVTAEVACLAGGTQMFVSAFSSDPATAEHIRNNLRDHIMNTHIID
jgi:hypothetical protein